MQGQLWYPDVSHMKTSGTHVSLNREVEHELSLLWGAEQNQSLPCYARYARYARYSCFRASLAHAYQENVVDIAVDTFDSSSCYFHSERVPLRPW